MLTSNLAGILGVRPTPGKIVVEVSKAAEKVGSIIVPETARDQVNQGKVYSVFEAGEVDGEAFTPYIQKGDFVVFGRYAGTKLEFQSERGLELYVLRETDVLVIVDYEFPPNEVKPELRGAVDDVVGELPYAD